MHKELNSFPGIVLAASFDPEDTGIATAADDGSVRVWDVETGEELMRLCQDSGPAWIVQFAPDYQKGTLLASSGSTLQTFDLFTGERVAAFEGHEGMVRSASFSSDGILVASASSDGAVNLWRRSDGRKLRIFNEHDDRTTQVIFSPDGETLSSVSDDGMVYIHMLKP